MFPYISNKYYTIECMLENTIHIVSMGTVRKDLCLTQRTL